MKLDPGMDKLQDELELTSQQRGILTSYMGSDGFAIVMRLWRDEVRKFTEAALNADIADDKKAMALLTKAKVAAQLYQGWVERLNHELATYEAQMSDVGTPQNPENNQGIDEFK